MNTRITVFMFLTSITGIAFDAMGQAKDIPIIPDVAVSAPSPDLPKDLAAFSGKWAGYFSGVKTGAYMADGLLVVEKISSANDIQVVFAGVGRFGTSNGQPYSYRVRASVVEGALLFEAGRMTISAKMAGDDTMNVTRTAGGGSDRGAFKRVVN